MTRRGRVGTRVERVTAAVRAGLVAPASDAAWVAALEAAGADPGYVFDRDYTRAVADLRAAVADDPLGPPSGWFAPGLSPPDRFKAWCRAHPRPSVEAARAWASELLIRAVYRIPQVTAAEFEELAGWVRANETRLRGLADADGLVPLGGGSGAVLDVVVEWLDRGPRWPGAGEAAEVVRRLRARYGGGGG